MEKKDGEQAMSELRRRLASMLVALAAEEEPDGYQVLAGVAVQELHRLAEGQAAFAQSVALLAKAADAQGRLLDAQTKLLEQLVTELRAHRVVVEELIGELQHMQEPDDGPEESSG